MLPSRQNLRLLAAFDVPIEPGSECDLRADVLSPALIPPAGLPVVLRIDGCPGWQTGSRWAALAPYANPYLANRGVVTIAASVRASSVAPWPAQLDDARCVLAWIERNPLQLPIDPSRVGVWGQSAGAHVAAMLAVTQLLGALQISAAVAISCPSDPNAADWPAAFLSDSPVTQLLGGRSAATTAARMSASPASNVGIACPPFLLIHGTADETVPFTQAGRFAEALAAAGAERQLEVIDAGHHNLHADPDAPYDGTVWTTAAARTAHFFEHVWSIRT
jgi:acetyl esterase/lipase